MPTYLFFSWLRFKPMKVKASAEKRLQQLGRPGCACRHVFFWKVRHLEFYFINVTFKLSLDFSYLKEGIIFDLFCHLLKRGKNQVSDIVTYIGVEERWWWEQVKFNADDWTCSFHCSDLLLISWQTKCCH